MSKPLIATIVGAMLLLTFFLLRPAGQNIIDEGGKNNPAAEKAYMLWKDYAPQNSEFHVLFPTPPRETNQSAFDIRTAKKKYYKIYTSEQLDSSLYVVTVISSPAGTNPSKDLKLLENTVADVAAQGVNNQLKSAVETTYKGEKAIRFDIESDVHALSGITFVHGEKLYILTRVSKLDRKNDEEFQHFLNHFKFNTEDEDEKK